MVCEEIIKILEQQSPEGYACDWDNVGLLVGSREKDVNCIFIALDATDEVIKEALEAGADMLLTHHPMIFKGLKKVSDGDFIGRRVIELIKNDMVYYAMHTNFDVAGMADLAAEKMGLINMVPLQAVAVATEMQQEPMGIGKVGNFSKAVSLDACVDMVKEAFGIETVKVFGWQESFLKNESIYKVAICPGSGKSVIRDALKVGADVLITGDVDHHEGIDAVAQNMAVIDAGHYGIEKIFVPYIQQFLEEQLKGVKIISEREKRPFIYV